MTGRRQVQNGEPSVPEPQRSVAGRSSAHALSVSIAGEKERAPNLFAWLMTGRGAEPGERQPLATGGSIKKAVKCDMCKDLSGGPACVRDVNLRIR